MSDRPPALALRPDNSLAAARGTMQLGVMLPPVYEQVAELDRSLKTLTATQAALKTKADDAQREAAELTSSRAELDKLLQLRNSETVAADARLSEVRAVTETVARQTQNLKTLIDRIATLRVEHRLEPWNDRGQRTKFGRRNAPAGLASGACCGHGRARRSRRSGAHPWRQRATRIMVFRTWLSPSCSAWG